MRISEMEITYQSGICLKHKNRKVILDPTKQSEVGVVTHGHLDHLIKNAYMTPPTLDILEVRKGEKKGTSIHYGFPNNIGGFDVTLYPAGHVFGSCMVMVEDLLYTGDFNPHGGRTCKRAVPYECNKLIIETTYGQRDYKLPNKEEVTKDIIAWTEHRLEEGPVVFGAYEFGKAQEIISLINELGHVPYVTEKIAELCDVYNRYDLDLRYRLKGIEEENFIAVVPPNKLKKPTGKIVNKVRELDGNTAYLSGWCAFYPFFNSMDLDAQFPFSDHAGFDELLNFVKECDPEKVYTVHGSSEEFSIAVKEDLGIEARALK